ncbi:MAG: YigZ family protein [Clostridia bacterium]|nr:YigZ family protein [Clostridia bacterium]
MSTEKIKRLRSSAEIEFVEKKSVFIGFCASIENEEQALEIIKQRKKKFADARHNVYAYILGDGTISRYSDDSEPQGTAGMPVLNAIRMSGITDVCVVVTRYFGGILLGAGGLVRAYSTSASMALEAGGIAIYEDFFEIKCSCSYSDYQRLLPTLTGFSIIIDDTSFETDIVVNFAVPEDAFTELKEKINEAFAGRILLEIVGKRQDCK